MIHFVTNQTAFAENLPFNRATVQDVYNYFRHKSQIEVDTETEGFDPYLHNMLTIQFGDFYNQYVIDLATVNFMQFADLLSTDKLYLLQNAKFDLRFFYHKGVRPKRIYDTFLAECILTTGYNNRRLALDHLASKYADAKLDKSVRGEIHRGLSTRVIKYAAYDVKYLGKIKDGQMAHLVDYKLANPRDPCDINTVLGLENRVVRVFADMEYHGVHIDYDKWVESSNEIKKGLEEQIDLLDSIILEEPKLSSFVPSSHQANLFGFKERKLKINYNSYQQKVAVLNELGFKVDSSKDSILQRLQDKHPFVKELRALNKLAKLDSSFGHSLLKTAYHSKTGRFHPNYWQILKTGRISVSEPNTNQIPARGKFGPIIRSAFTAPKDYKIVGGDYSAMELRELAQFSKDPLWLDIFNKGKDLHSVLCAETFNISADKVRNPYPNNPTITYRDIQKTINYGLAYGMSAQKLADTMNVPKSEAQEVIDSFFRKVPMVQKKLEQFGIFGMNNGYIRTAPPYGRIRWFGEHKAAMYQKDGEVLSAIKRASMNMPIQGTNADITKRAMVIAYEEIERKKLPVHIVLSVYDELQTEVHEDYAKEWKSKLQVIMEESAKTIIKSVPVLAECSISNYWDH